MSGTLGVQGALWALSLLVMRLLQPSDYGLVGIVAVFFGMFRTVQDAGIGPALVQCPTLNRRLLNSAFWFFVITSTLIVAVTFIGAPLLGLLKGETRLPGVMRALSLTFIVGGIRAVPMALLTRTLRFRERTIAEISSAAIGSLATLALAFASYGVWSLVAGNLVTETALAAISWIYAGWSPGRDCDWAGLKPILRFGLPVMMSTILWQFYFDSDFLMIGILLGPQQLGLYTIAWQIGLIPAERISAVLNKANLPVFSQMKDDPERIRRHWNTLMSMVAWTAFPVAAGMALVGGDFIRVFLAMKWTGSIPLLVPLCILGGIRAIVVILPSLLVAVGRPDKLLKFNFTCCVIYPIAFAACARFGGTLWVAWTWVILCPLFYIWMVHISYGLTPLRGTDYFAPLQAPFVTTLLMATLVWVASRLVSSPDLAHLIFQVLIGAISYCVLGGLWLRRTHQLSLDRIGLRT
jgi:O-antigen/teichoic acid export membrane protein